MLFLRSLLFYLGMWLITVPYAVVVVLILPFKPTTRYRILTTWGRAVMIWLRATCNITYEVEGREHIPQKASVILAKHQSTWETIALQSIFPDQTWVLKRELLRIPIFGWGLWACWPVAIDRAAGKEALRQVVEQGKERLANGFWMVVFPEGTRVAPGTKGKYAVGGAMLAEKAGVPVVPVAHNAGEHWPKGRFLKFPGRVRVVIGPVIETEGRKASEIIQKTEEWIEGQMAKISSLPSS